MVKRGSVQILQEIVHVYLDSRSLALAVRDSLLCELKPRLESKVDCLCDVVARIEARVVGLGSAYDKLAWSLNDFVQFDAVLQ